MNNGIRKKRILKRINLILLASEKFMRLFVLQESLGQKSVTVLSRLETTSSQKQNMQGDVNLEWKHFTTIKIRRTTDFIYYFLKRQM